MAKIPRSSLRLAATLAGSTVMALPAVAIDQEDVLKLCEDFVLNHSNEPASMNACIGAIQEFEAQLPPRTPTAEVHAEESRLPPAIPSALVVRTQELDQQPHDDDGDQIVLILRSGNGSDVLVEIDAGEIQAEPNAYLNSEHLGGY